MFRLWPALALAVVAGCGQVSPATTPIASAGGSTNPASPIAQPPNTQPGPVRSVVRDGPIQGVPKELATAEVVINTKTGEGNSYLAEFLLSDTWMFWRKTDDGNGIVTWLFVRPKHPGVELDAIMPRQPAGPRTSGTERP